MNRMEYLPEGVTDHRIFISLISLSVESAPSSALKLARNIIYSGKSQASF